MAIPSQQEILVPFLETLRDGQPHTRGEILFILAKRFNLSEEELNQQSGNHFTIINRLAWCDTYFRKAEFVEKEKDGKDNLQDLFRITAVGQMQLMRHASRIDVGYLQSFYQGNIFRGGGSSYTTSDAELALYEKLEQLPKPFATFHSVSWFAQKSAYGTVGEVDFLIAHPDHGILVLEAKGGELSIVREGNRNVWYSKGFYGNTREIKDPCSQAERNRRELHDYLQTNRLTRGHDYALFPAVAAPDSVIRGDIRMDCPEDIFIDMRHLEDLPTRILEIFAYWKPRADRANQAMGGTAAIKALIEALVPTRKLAPRIGDVFARERQKIDQLTEQQFRTLRSLRRHKRAAIVGGAGTGKTMLAMEKAQQLADDGFKVLFLAFNRNISGWIGQNLKDPLITVSTYHSLAGKLSNEANVPRYGRDFYEEAPELLIQATERFRAGDIDRLYDAVIVDEAQDFNDEMWISVPELLKDPQNGVLYVFFDDSQRLYQQMSQVPLETDPFYLTDNCRNTQRIHTTMMPYATADSESYCDGPLGRDVEIISVSGQSDRQRKLQKILHNLVHEENVAPEQIVILTPCSEKRSDWKDDQFIGNFVLTWDMDSDMNMAIKICSIYSFKGLEKAVVILTELDSGQEHLRRQLLYVGLSRARHHAIVLGDLPQV